jgi:hypothetical protein
MTEMVHLDPASLFCCSHCDSKITIVFSHCSSIVIQTLDLRLQTLD